MTSRTAYSSRKVIAIALLPLLCIMFRVCSVEAAENQELLKTVRNFDDVYEKGVFSSGRHTCTSPPWAWGQTKDKVTDYTWAYTQSGQLRAVFETSNFKPLTGEDEPVIPN